MITVSIDQVSDYCDCPMKFKLKHLDNRKKKKSISVIEKYEHDIHKAIYSIFSNIQNNESLTINEVTRTWGMLWIGNRTKYDIMYSKSCSWSVIENERRQRGTETLVNLFNHYKEKPGIPIIVNKGFSIPISSDITLTGIWELVRDFEGRVELIDFKVDDKVHNKVSINKDLSVTAMVMAFRNEFNTIEDSILIHGVNSGKISRTTRSDKDFEFLKYTVECVVFSIKNNLFYAKPDDKCYSCPYRLVCKNGL